jgi:Tol biopolymer transport system component
LLDATGAAAPRTVPLPTLDLDCCGIRYAHVATFMRPPLGERILAWTNEYSPGYLDVTDADGSNATRLIDETWCADHGYELTTEGDGGVHNARWSPDGSMIAFDTYLDGQERVVVMGADGAEPRVIGEGSNADWSPDGSRIKSHRDCDEAEGCQTPLTIIDVATGTERDVARVTDLSGSWWSPDGTSILYTSGEQGRMHTVDVETGKVTDLPWESEFWYPGGPSWQRVAAD